MVFCLTMNLHDAVKTFVTRKITRAVSRIKEGLQDMLLLGNLNAKRDWGYAPEYCEGMYLILQQKKPDDFVLATGKQYSVREFVELAFKELGINIDWEGEGKMKLEEIQSRVKKL